MSNFKALLVAVLAGAISATGVVATTQCGGMEYKGEVDCGTGYNCVEVTPYYSECMPTSNAKVSTRQVGFDPVIGVPGTCFPRRKIERLQADFPNQFNMFILGLEAFMKMDESLDLSWYQLNGIHGAPKIPWQQPCLTCVPAGTYVTSVGYCTHGSAIFGTWHRPYILLLEQTLSQKAIEIANKFSGAAKATYLDAAAAVRMPYWDWSDPTTQSHLPLVTTQRTITVTVPQAGTGNPVTQTIENPLFEYKFKNKAFQQAYFQGNYANWNSTRRQPQTSTGPSDNAVADNTMQMGYTSRRSATFNALSATSFNTFNSRVESVHNAIHTNVGGGGHMSTLDYSAFDPIFWLHHTNVDRLLAMYQASHPGQYLTPASPSQTFGRRVTQGFPTQQDNLTTPLIPFKHPNGQWWTSNDIKDVAPIWNHGYGYEEVPCDFQTNSANELITFVNTQINALYGPSTSPASSASSSRVAAVAPTGPTKRLEYAIRVIIDVSEIPGSWSFLAFDGKPTSDPKKWKVSPTIMGSIAAFWNTGEMKASKAFVNEIYITDSLVEAGVDVNDQPGVISYLQKNLNWGVELQGARIDASGLKTLKVACTAREAEYPADEAELPVFGSPVVLVDVTKGKIGGVKSEKEVETAKLLGGEVVKVETEWA